MAEAGRPLPRELTRSGDRDIRVLWQDGHESLFAAWDLRMQCPCAACVDEWTGRRILKGKDVSKDVSPVAVELVGRYGVRIRWSDGHSDGIFTFLLLRKLCPCSECRGSTEN